MVLKAVKSFFGEGTLCGMTRHRRIIMACVLIGSLFYFFILQASLLLSSPPGEPLTPEFRKICSSSKERKTSFGLLQSEEELTGLPIIYVVTPTYRRPEMAAELTRLGQTLLLVPKLHWIVAEDSPDCSKVITSFLTNLGLPYTHIVSPMPDSYRRLSQAPRGVSNRRAAVRWVMDYGQSNGVLYFLDDDNAIDVRLFEEMRDTQKVSMWPVGLIGNYAVSSPILNRDGVVNGFYDAWPAGRKFQVDMAGFAVNVEFMKTKRNVTMPYIAGHEEDGFLKSLNINLSDIEPKAVGCTEILVWHTRTDKNPLRSLSLYEYQKTNINSLAKQMKLWGVIK